MSKNDTPATKEDIYSINLQLNTLQHVISDVVLKVNRMYRVFVPAMAFIGIIITIIQFIGLDRTLEVLHKLSSHPVAQADMPQTRRH